jgi:hypothetical protein
LCDADAWCFVDLWCTGLEVAAEADAAVNAATGRTRPSTAKSDLREVVTGGSRKNRRCGKRLTDESRKHA